MANAFSKEEIVAFENILEGFNDALILSKNINVYNTNGVTMERARDTIWRPQPYIAQSFSRTVGTTIAATFEHDAAFGSFDPRLQPVFGLADGCSRTA